MWLNGPGPQIRAKSLNRDADASATTAAHATANATADYIAAQKIWIFKSFSRITF